MQAVLGGACHVALQRGPTTYFRIHIVMPLLKLHKLHATEK